MSIQHWYSVMLYAILFCRWSFEIGYIAKINISSLRWSRTTAVLAVFRMYGLAEPFAEHHKVWNYQYDEHHQSEWCSEINIQIFLYWTKLRSLRIKFVTLVCFSFSGSSGNKGSMHMWQWVTEWWINAKEINEMKEHIYYMTMLLHDAEPLQRQVIIVYHTVHRHLCCIVCWILWRVFLFDRDHSSLSCGS